MKQKSTASDNEVVSPPVSATSVHWVKRPKTPSPQLQRLRRLARTHRAPQSWYDEGGDCPFVLAKR